MASAVATRWPLIGRFEQLEHLDTALATAAVDGVLLTGSAGVGKTRLSEEFRVRAEHAGHPTSRVVASRAASSTPLGALAHLVPRDLVTGADAIDPVAVFGHIADALASAEHRRVLVVDDAHLLDETSLVVIAQLLASGGVFLVASIRSGEPIPDGLNTLLRTDRCETLGLAPLTEMDVDTLLHLALAGPVDAVLRSALWDLSGGVPLVLTEVVRRAKESAAMVDIDGVWVQRAPLGVTARVVDLFAARPMRTGGARRHCHE